MSELYFETIVGEPHAAIGPATELFSSEMPHSLPVMMMCEGYRLYVATKGSKLVGAANACIDLFDDCGYIRKLVVNSEYRNQKIGTALLQHAMDDMREIGKPKTAICPSNDDNERLYRRLGFVHDPTVTGISSWLFKDLHQHKEV